MNKIIVAALLVLTCGVALAQSADAQAVIKVGTATAHRGEVAIGMIEVPAGSDAATSIPVVVAHGAKPGRVLAVVSGAHGTEYASVIALEKLIPLLRPAEMAGTVIVVPLVNIASFEQKVPHVNPIDKKSMNRFYPGNMQGTQTERASYLITKQVVEQSDHLIDLHGGDLDENLRAYSYWTRTGNAAQDKTSKEMLLAFGLDHIIMVADRPKDPNASRYLENTATTRGKASITAEAGRIGRVDADDVDALVRGCMNVMAYLHILDRPVSFVEHPVWIERLADVSSEATGIFYPLVDRGTYANKGMKIGYVTDYVNRPLWEVKAPASGEVLYIRGVPSLVKGDTVVSIGVVAAAEP